MTGEEITRIFEECEITSKYEDTKWRRIFAFFMDSQTTYQADNEVGKFIECWAKPVRFFDRDFDYRNYIKQMNQVLEYDNLKINEIGKMERLKNNDYNGGDLSSINDSEDMELKDRWEGKVDMADKHNATDRIFIVHGHDEVLKEK